tara:strand:- start:2448 stop:2582 length:135 start_codon:yes stop_codon:yes gene_type:complete
VTGGLLLPFVLAAVIVAGLFLWVFLFFKTFRFPREVESAEEISL